MHACTSLSWCPPIRIQVAIEMNSDLLNPLSSLDWEFSSNWPGGHVPAQAVFLHDRIYLGETTTTYYTSGQNKSFGKIGYASAGDDFKKWQYYELTEPYVSRFGLGVYQSRLVLVGGVKASGKLVNDVWFSDDGIHWHRSKAVPPLPIVCGAPGVVNTGDPEYLIVAGGFVRVKQYGVDVDASTDKVFVLVKAQWSSLQPLAVPCSYVRHTSHNGNVYLLGASACVYCRRTALVSACDSARMGKTNETSLLWKMVPGDRTQNIVSFGQRLLAIKRTVEPNEYRFAEYGIFVHCPLKSWVHVGDLYRDIIPKCVVALSPWRLLVLGIERSVSESRYRAFTATLSGK